MKKIVRQLLLIVGVVVAGLSPTACEMSPDRCSHNVQRESADVTVAARSENEAKAITRSACEQACQSVNEEYCGQGIDNLTVTPGGGHDGGMNQYSMRLTCSCTR